MRENRLLEIHIEVNGYEDSVRDKTYKEECNQIGTIFATEKVTQIIKGG